MSKRFIPAAIMLGLAAVAAFVTINRPPPRGEPKAPQAAEVFDAAAVPAGIALHPVPREFAPPVGFADGIAIANQQPPAGGLFGTFAYPTLLEALPDLARGIAMIGGGVFEPKQAGKSAWVAAGLAAKLLLGEPAGCVYVSQGKLFKRKGMKPRDAAARLRRFEAMSEREAQSGTVVMADTDVEAMEVLSRELRKLADEAEGK